MDAHERRTGERLSASSLSQRIRARGGSVSHTTITNILKGANTNPSLNTLTEVADFLGCPIEDLTGNPVTSPGRRPARHRTLAEKLTYALDKRRQLRPDEQHTPEQIAAVLVRDHAVTRCTGDVIRQLITDPAANPTKDVLQGLAAYLGVPAGYLLDDDEAAARVEQQLEDLSRYASAARTARDTGVAGWAARLGKLSPGKLAAVMAVVEAMNETPDEDST
jgi:transcriptional regulator with XRE-family HTH domain